MEEKPEEKVMHPAIHCYGPNDRPPHLLEGRIPICPGCYAHTANALKNVNNLLAERSDQADRLASALGRKNAEADRLAGELKIATVKNGHLIDETNALAHDVREAEEAFEDARVRFIAERDDYRERLKEAQEQRAAYHRTVKRFRAELAAERFMLGKPKSDRARLPRLDNDYVDAFNFAIQSIVPSNSEQLRQLTVRVSKLERFERKFNELQRHAALVVRAVREEISELGIQVRQLGSFRNRVEHYARRIWGGYE